LGDRPLVGTALSEIPALHEGLRFLNEPELGRDEAVIGDPPRYFDVGQVPLHYAGREVGRVIVLRDISNRKELQRQLREQSIRDALTGLHNRRFLDELGPVMFADAVRTAAPLAAVMLDIDHFKGFNDSHGHEAGDAMLRASGAFLLQNVRQTDAVFRMGGEEFLVLLPHTQLAQALVRADAWRREFMELGVSYEGTELHATISAGVAVYPADADDLRALLHRADLALYRAKGSGRNRVLAWESEEQSSRR
jgi:diguanylate cyclase (GGDEF)-like protein